MTDYDIEDLLKRAGRGQSIVVIADRLFEADVIFQTFTPRVFEGNDDWKIRRANGQKAINHTSGGRIYFRSLSWLGHGFTVDVAVLALRRTTRINDLLVSLVPAMATSPHRNIIIAPELAAGLQ